MRILFILKKNQTYGFTTHVGEEPDRVHKKSTGLFNSTNFIVRGLLRVGVHAKIVEVIDNHCIDREVHLFKPDIVIIEAIWVVPEKFTILKKLHPRVKWFVHLHSHMPFLAIEGMAMRWIHDYVKHGVKLIANSKPSYEALLAVVPCEDLLYLENVYLSTPMASCERDSHDISVGCFGAVRPLKNQLLQAMAALKYAKKHRKHLVFHMNGSRIETGGHPVLKNIIQMFEDQKAHGRLVLSKWNEPEEFLEYLNKRIDIGMQVSLTETFNVVCADYVTAGIPVVASKEVSWLSNYSKAQDDDINSMVEKMEFAMHHRLLIKLNQWHLHHHSEKAQKAWHEFVKENAC